MKEGSTHPQVVFSIYAVAHLRLNSPLLGRYIEIHGFNFLQAGLSSPADWLTKRCGPILEALPQGMTPSQVRSLLATSSAIQATASKCIMVYAERICAMRPLEVTEPINFDVYADTLDDLPDGPRYHVSKPSEFTWNEEQRLLKALWMVYLARSFFKKLNQGGLDWPTDQVAKASSLKAIDLFQFERHSVCHTLFRKRPRDYLLSALHIYLSAEEFLEENNTMPLIEVQPPCRQKKDSDDEDDWLAVSASVSETMEHFVRLFKEARSHLDGDGFYPWRRLGFAIWDDARLSAAGLMNDADNDRGQDRVRWLSVIRKEDFAYVQNHRLMMHARIAETEPDYRYPEDTDESWSP